MSKLALGKFTYVLTSTLMLGACTTVGPDIKQPEVTWLDNWSGVSLQAVESTVLSKDHHQVEKWWLNFNDPILESLIEQALRLNPDVRVAGLRTMEERAEQTPQTDARIIVDNPANMLRLRPDVRASEMRLAAQSVLIGVSVADLYPSISLLGSIGVSDTSLLDPETQDENWSDQP